MYLDLDRLKIFTFGRVSRGCIQLHHVRLMSSYKSFDLYYYLDLFLVL